MAIRVLRIIEYQFEDYEAMDAHVKRMQIPLNGKKRFGPHCEIRSAAVDVFEQDSSGFDPPPTSRFNSDTIGGRRSDDSSSA